MLVLILLPHLKIGGEDSHTTAPNIEGISMSMTVLVIGFAHGLLPIIGAMVNKKVGLMIGTAVGIFMALAMGGSRYAAVDLIGVAAGFALSWYILTENEKDNE